MNLRAQDAYLFCDHVYACARGEQTRASSARAPQSPGARWPEGCWRPTLRGRARVYVACHRNRRISRISMLGFVFHICYPDGHRQQESAHSRVGSDAVLKTQLQVPFFSLLLWDPEQGHRLGSHKFH
jgi:hypothetical protein